MKNWTGQRILIIGGARQGLAAARFLARQGAVVTLNDRRSAEQMRPARQSLESPEAPGILGELARPSLPIRWVLGEHPLSLLDETDLVCISAGVPLTLPIVAETLRRGLPLTNDSQIFMDAVPCRVIGITGSAGKTTTTTLVGRMAQTAVQAPARVWVGGNIGLPLIDHLDEISADDLVVLELSSFQLEQMTHSPQVAVVLNITPNHLDRHGTMETYVAAKANILAYQNANDTAVLGRDNPGSWLLSGIVRGRLVSFGLQAPAAGQVGTFAEVGADGICQVWLQDESGRHALLPTRLIRLRGLHNLVNVLAACAIAAAAGLPASAMAAGVDGFNGVPHRLEWVRSWHGAEWFNDSIATAPERSMAAIRSFEEPLVLLLGGRDKNLPWNELAEQIRQRVDHVVVFGEAAPKIIQAFGSPEIGQRPYTLVKCAGLKEAVQAAAQIAGPGDVVLLSPGGTSYDEFIDFEERGERYREWVKLLI